jgi:hypothetical protein
MKQKLFLVLMVLAMSFPVSAHAFGFLQYLCDALTNQFGFDRGPIPKVAPLRPQQDINSQGLSQTPHPDRQRIHLQADGF